MRARSPVAVDDDAERGHPGDRPQRLLSGVQGGGPDALEQVSDLLDLANAQRSTARDGHRGASIAPMSRRPVQGCSSATARSGER